MNLVKLTTPTLGIQLDSATGDIVLSLAEAPFSERPPGKVVDVQSYANNAFLTGVSLTAKTCTLSFDFGEVEPRNTSLQLLVSYDPLA